MLTLNEIMASNLYTLKPDNTLQDAIELMESKRIRHIPIVGSNRQLLGLVTQRDILAASSPESTSKHQEMNTLLETIMITTLDTVNKGVGLRQAALFLQQHKHGCLPVVENNTLIGLVTDSDFVTIAIHLLELLEATEPVENTDDDFTESLEMP
jgi:CBS domain-containing protein